MSGTGLFVSPKLTSLTRLSAAYSKLMETRAFGGMSAGRSNECAYCTPMSGASTVGSGSECIQRASGSLMVGTQITGGVTTFAGDPTDAKKYSLRIEEPGGQAATAKLLMLLSSSPGERGTPKLSFPVRKVTDSDTGMGGGP